MNKNIRNSKEYWSEKILELIEYQKQMILTETLKGEGERMEEYKFTLIPVRTGRPLDLERHNLTLTIKKFKSIADEAFHMGVTLHDNLVEAIRKNEELCTSNIMIVIDEKTGCICDILRNGWDY